jgi:hypothetical protein
VAAGTAGGTSPERLWWLRTLAVFQSPSSTFAALRDDSERQADARQEPVLAITWLAGIAAVLTFGSTTATLLDFQVSDDFFRPTQLDTVEALVYIFLAGGLFALSSYWLGGGALHLGARAAAGRASYRQARHVVAFALAPAVLSLLLWPFRLLLFGEDNFRSGGADSGVAGTGFALLQWAFFLWALGLLILGLRTLNDWSVVRSIGAVLLAVMALGALALLFSLG